MSRDFETKVKSQYNKYRSLDNSIFLVIHISSDKTILDKILIFEWDVNCIPLT